MNSPKLIWGLGFSHGAQSLLQRLKQAGLVDAIVTVDATPAPAEVLQQQWPRARGFVVIAACGLVTRLVAPLLQDKLLQHHLQQMHFLALLLRLLDHTQHKLQSIYRKLMQLMMIVLTQLLQQFQAPALLLLT